MRAFALTFGNRTAPSDVALWRRILCGLLLVSFFWISYVAQTHIHGQPTNATAPSISKTFSAAPHLTNKAPAKGDPDDSANCPLCQAVALGSAVLLPLLLVLLAFRQSLQAPVPLGLEIFRPSHVRYGHQTRGPPSL